MSVNSEDVLRPREGWVARKRLIDGFVYLTQDGTVTRDPSAACVSDTKLGLPFREEHDGWVICPRVLHRDGGRRDLERKLAAALRELAELGELREQVGRYQEEIRRLTGIITLYREVDEGALIPYPTIQKAGKDFQDELPVLESRLRKLQDLVVRYKVMRSSGVKSSEAAREVDPLLREWVVRRRTLAGTYQYLTRSGNVTWDAQNAYVYTRKGARSARDHWVDRSWSICRRRLRVSPRTDIVALEERCRVLNEQLEHYTDIEHYAQLPSEVTNPEAASDAQQCLFECKDPPKDDSKQPVSEPESSAPRGDAKSCDVTGFIA